MSQIFKQTQNLDAPHTPKILHIHTNWLYTYWPQLTVYSLLMRKCNFRITWQRSALALVSVMFCTQTTSFLYGSFLTLRGYIFFSSQYCQHTERTVLGSISLLRHMQWESSWHLHEMYQYFPIYSICSVALYPACICWYTLSLHTEASDKKAYTTQYAEPTGDGYHFIFLHTVYTWV